MAKTKKSSLLAALGTKGKKAVSAHRSDDTDFGKGGNLPGGIDGGIAQLIDCRFGVYKPGTTHAGEYFFLAAGTVKAPKQSGGVPIEGMRTQITEPMCDTPEREGDNARRTVEDHVAYVLNEMRKLGVDTSDSDVEDFEEIAETLKEEKPHFRFRTFAWTMGERSGVKEQWRGVCEYVDDDDEDAVVDETEDDDDSVVDDSDDSEDDDIDLSAQAIKADKGDGASQLLIEEQAKKVGLDANDYETWTDAANAIESSDSNDSDDNAEADDDDETSVPEKGEVYSYKPPRARKPVDCEVMAVFSGKETCNLKNLDEDGKTYKSVAWGDLT